MSRSVGVPTETTATSRDTAFHAIDRWHSEATCLRHRIEALADRLTGAVPQEPSSDGKNPLPSDMGLFRGVGITAEDGLSQIERCHAAINRIEQHLP